MVHAYMKFNYGTVNLLGKIFYKKPTTKYKYCFSILKFLYWTFIKKAPIFFS